MKENIYEIIPQDNLKESNTATKDGLYTVFAGTLQMLPKKSKE